MRSQSRKVRVRNGDCLEIWKSSGSGFARRLKWVTGRPGGQAVARQVDPRKPPPRQGRWILGRAICGPPRSYLLAVKDNQPTLHADIKSYFQTAPKREVEQVETIGKDHGRFEVRTYTVSHVVDWYAAPRSYPGAPRFPQLTTIAMVESRIERGDKIETEQRSYISSRALSAAAFADGARGHWGIENNLHWTLDVTFNEDQSRLRAGHGAKNMAVVRHLALNLVRQAADKRSIKRRRKRAAWDPKYLLEILGPLRC